MGNRTIQWPAMFGHSRTHKHLHQEKLECSFSQYYVSIAARRLVVPYIINATFQNHHGKLCIYAYWIE